MISQDNSYQAIYASGISIRRYPETDVVAFASRLPTSRIVADLGTGTGRNLLPLLLCAKSGGLVIASDLSSAGLQVIANWCHSLGGGRKIEYHRD